MNITKSMLSVNIIYSGSMQARCVILRSRLSNEAAPYVINASGDLVLWGREMTHLNIAALYTSYSNTVVFIAKISYF